MRKLVLASGLALAAIAKAGLGQAQMPDSSCTAISCLQTQANVKNPITTTTTTTTTLANQISAALQGSVLNAGTLSQTTTNTWTGITGGPGSSFNTANLTNNTITETPTKGSVGGAVSMSNSMVGGQGILQANQNTGANAVQQNSVALTSTAGAGGLSGFSPTITGPLH
jgi:hypothetical protein